MSPPNIPLSPVQLAYIIMALESTGRMIIRNLAEKTEEELKVFIQGEEKLKDEHDTWLINHGVDLSKSPGGHARF